MSLAFSLGYVVIFLSLGLCQSTPFHVCYWFYRTILRTLQCGSWISCASLVWVRVKPVLYRPLSPAITEITKTFNKTSYWVWPDPILKKLTCINRSGLTTKHLIWNESNPGQGHHSNILFSVNQGYVLTVVLACNSVCFLFSELSLLVYFYSCQQDTGWFQCNMDTNP